MKPQTLMICKGWISAAGQERGDALISLLAPSDQQTYSALPEPIPLDKEHIKMDPLDQVHFSWIAPLLRTLSKGEIPLFLSALKQSQREGLCEALGYSNHFPRLRTLAKQSLRALLRSHLMEGQRLVPLAFLPLSGYNRLLDLSETHLGRLIRYLGLHDLSFEMRQIIATKELKKIFSSLTPKEGTFLNSLLLHQEPLIFERLFLNAWDGSKEQLHKLLDERGLNRLGHAVSEESESLIWYLTHKLNMRWGTLLLKFRKKPTHARGGQILEKQISKILKETG